MEAGEPVSVAALLTQSCTLKRKTTVQDTTVNGGPISQWATSLTALPCSIQLLSASEAFRMGYEQGARMYEGYFEFGTGVLVTDAVLLGSQWFSVVGIVPDDVGRNAYERAVLREEMGAPPV